MAITCTWIGWPRPFRTDTGVSPDCPASRIFLLAMICTLCSESLR